MVFVMGEMHNEDSKRTRQTSGNERTLPRSAPANEFNCETSSGHFVVRYRFRKILIRVCEWSQGNEENEWSLMFLKILKNMCEWSQGYDESE